MKPTHAVARPASNANFVVAAELVPCRFFGNLLQELEALCWANRWVLNPLHKLLQLGLQVEQRRCEGSVLSTPGKAQGRTV